MTIEEMREAYNRAYRKTDDLQDFCSAVIPNVFKLLEYIEDAHENNTGLSQAATLAAACRPKSTFEFTAPAERYTGGKAKVI